MKTKPILKVRLREPETKHYFEALVFRNKRDMYAYYDWYKKRWNGESSNNEYYLNRGITDIYNFAAICMPFELLKEVAGAWVRHEKIGELLFVQDRLGTGVISHELLHAALWHERLVHENKTATFGEHIGEAEERMAHTHTAFIIKFVNTLYAKKII